MKLLQALPFAAAAALSIALVTAVPSRAERIFRYCMIGTPNMGKSCTYDSLELCRVAASAGVGFCQENPAYTVASRQVMPARKQR